MEQHLQGQGGDEDVPWFSPPRQDLWNDDGLQQAGTITDRAKLAPLQAACRTLAASGDLESSTHEAP